MKRDEIAELDLVDDAQFFAPVSTDLFSSLIAQYQAARAQVERLGALMADELHAGAIHYFLEGNKTEERGRWSMSLSAEQLFHTPGAIAALNSAYWSKALALTDVLDIMPQKRRSEWHEIIRTNTCPEFEEETVRNTLRDLLNMRAQFVAERVDGIFRGLSGEHVTNAPEAFGKRMIIARVLTSYDTIEHNTAGLINDLRCVVAKFMGRDEPGYDASTGLLRSLKGRWGEWVSVDGGALRIRLYMKGTAHMEVHPDMAWRLNQILAHLYPLAIPAQFRQRPKRRAKVVPLMQRPLPFAVLAVLAGFEQARQRVPQAWPERWERVPNTIMLRGGGHSAHAMAEAAQVLMSLGGTTIPGNGGWWAFDYDPLDVINDIVVSGCVPDQKAHQFYPTPLALAERVIELAEIGDGMACLEPSAGTGNLASLMPTGTTCVEASSVHVKVLQGLGLQAVHGDFIAWADKSAQRFDRVVMNPPFDQGRWLLHLERAADLLAPGGRLVAVLPSGAQGRDPLPGLAKTWHGPFDNQFPGTSVSVVVLVANKDSQ